MTNRSGPQPYFRHRCELPRTYPAVRHPEATPSACEAIPRVCCGDQSGAADFRPARRLCLFENALCDEFRPRRAKGVPTKDQVESPVPALVKGASLVGRRSRSSPPWCHEGLRDRTGGYCGACRPDHLVGELPGTAATRPAGRTVALDPPNVAASRGGGVGAVGNRGPERGSIDQTPAVGVVRPRFVEVAAPVVGWTLAEQALMLTGASLTTAGRAPTLAGAVLTLAGGVRAVEVGVPCAGFSRACRRGRRCVR